MSKTTLAQVAGFTPLIDAIVQEHGIVTAAVFGKAWRYCQMADGVCKASQERIAAELGMTRITVNTHIAKLVEAGYLTDKTPNLIGSPHVYADTGKANLSISITGGVNEINRGCKEDLQGGVKDINTKKVVKKEKKVKKQKQASTTPPLSFEVKLYHAVVGRYPNKETYPIVEKAIQKITARLGRPTEAADLLPFFTTWLTRSTNKYNLSVWLLEWAVNGTVTQWGKQQNSERANMETL